jgi:cell division protein FtsX
VQQRPRKLLVLVVAVVAVVVALGAVVTVLLVAGDDGTASPPAVTDSPVTTTRFCKNEVVVFADTDEEMRRIARTLRGDERIRRLDTMTKQDAFERYKVVFKDNPELLEAGRPEALPASVELTPALGVTPPSLAEQLRAELPTATQVRSSPC